jgi:uncharacterized protein YyaL (SSP411 family)
MEKSNRLAGETSPYLLQHAHNPVNWYPWGEEAFETAKKENKPLFISIGYSTCHWCHVMAKESFEDAETASILNENYICIKVDREEYPDVDHFYMEACQLMTGHGGWPLSIFTAHNKKPFLAGTYFPREGRNGQMGFKDILLRVSDVWINSQESVRYNINEIQQSLSMQQAFDNRSPFNNTVFTKAFEYLYASFDHEYGGFGEAPKFPAPHNLLFLLRYFHHYKDETALHMVETTAKHICAGGIYDHIANGFHRYSTDGKWVVPHFEKMLYDQAMMILLLTDLYRITQSSFYKHYLEGTIEFVIREMTSPSGGFYSAFDADSDGTEGKYYIWNYDELSSLLTEEELVFIKKFFNVKVEGNFSQGHFGFETGNNILCFSLKHTDEFETVMESFLPIRAKLSDARKRRTAPAMDKKVLTDWNGLMIYALSAAAFYLDKKEYMNAAETAFSFIVKSHADENSLFHSSVDGKINKNAILDDYAYTGLAGVNLFQFTGSVKYLNYAVKFAAAVGTKFYDNERELFKLSESFFSEESIYIFDNAYPSGNSAAFLLFSRLFHITKNDIYYSYIEPLLESTPEVILKYPSGATFLLQTLFDLNFNFKEVIIAFTSESALPKAFGALRASYEPDKAVILINPANIAQMGKINGFYDSFRSHFEKGKKESILPALFVCDKEGCSLPESF